MKTPLSPRLLACCQLIRPGDTVADVGCDHGYLGIHLLKNGIAQAVIASDVNPQPLACARKNALKYGTLDKMRFFLTDGVAQLPRDFTVLVCAGMGADTMISILEQAVWLRADRYRLVLQCQSKTSALRRYLWEAGWQIREEIPVMDGKFIYTVIEAVYAPGQRFTPGQCYLSPALMRHTGPLLDGYRARILAGLEAAVRGRGDNADPMLIRAYEELSKEAPYVESQ